ncbi:class I SAM-dependent methyltransferase [Xanthomarina gelatinilytica]|uniref:class I SAM-dependent methyltransferase n=1 Tax=Xanthomarina gelatinilytica TaxID=1137281 RepID=UPI003AA98873
MAERVMDSIIDKKAKATLIKTIKVDALINGYKKEFDIDVKKYFKTLTEIYIYECESTKLRFFYPFDIEGDSEFYEQLQKFDWYYMPWKWEHEITKNALIGKEKILEVGSGGLGFVEKMHNLGYSITGLELNKSSIKEAKDKGLKVLEESLELHAESNYQKYDVVCSFQVLEHVTQVNSFIRSKVDCLKSGGKLIVAVPNNDSFIKWTDGGLLNKPPHHMGLWNRKSLLKLADCFDLKTEKIFYEPLQYYHVNWYINSLIETKIKPRKTIYKIFKKLKLKRLLVHYVRLNQKYINGHSMLVVYKKI